MCATMLTDTIKFDDLNLDGFGEDEMNDDTSSFILELDTEATEAANAASVYVEYDADGKRLVKAPSLDSVIYQ